MHPVNLSTRTGSGQCVYAFAVGYTEAPRRCGTRSEPRATTLSLRCCDSDPARAGFAKERLSHLERTHMLFLWVGSGEHTEPKPCLMLSRARPFARMPHRGQSMRSMHSSNFDALPFSLPPPRHIHHSTRTRLFVVPSTHGELSHGAAPRLRAAHDPKKRQAYSSLVEPRPVAERARTHRPRPGRESRQGRATTSNRK